MQLDLTTHQQERQRLAREVGRTLATVTDPGELAARLGASGLLDSAHEDALAGSLVIEELSAARPAAGAVAWATARFVEPVRRFGSDVQKAEILAAVTSGRAVGCLAIDEGPHGEPWTTTVTRDADGSFVVRGVKRYVALGAAAEHALVIAGTTSAPIALLVRRGAPGLAFDGTSSSCALRFDDVHVPPGAVVGGEGGGQHVVHAALAASRLAIAAHAVGVARGALDRAVERVRERRATTPSSELQSATFALADMVTRVDASRLLVSHAALSGSADDATMAKLFASEAAAFVTSRAIELFGLDGADAGELSTYHAAARRTVLEAGAGDALRAKLALWEGERLA